MATEPKVLVIYHQPTGLLWTGTASSNDEAYAQAEQELGFHVMDCPVYDIDNDDDIKVILSIIKQEA